MAQVVIAVGRFTPKEKDGKDPRLDRIVAAIRRNRHREAAWSLRSKLSEESSELRLPGQLKPMEPNDLEYMTAFRISGLPVAPKLYIGQPRSVK